MPETHIDPMVWKRSKKVLKTELLRDAEKNVFIIRTTFAETGKVQDFTNEKSEDLFTEYLKATTDEVDDDC